MNFNERLRKSMKEKGSEAVKKWQKELDGMTQQQPNICPICKKDQISSALAKDGRTRICWTCKEDGK